MNLDNMNRSMNIINDKVLLGFIKNNFNDRDYITELRKRSFSLSNVYGKLSIDSIDYMVIKETKGGKVSCECHSLIKEKQKDFTIMHKELLYVPGDVIKILMGKYKIKEWTF